MRAADEERENECKLHAKTATLTPTDFLRDKASTAIHNHNTTHHGLERHGVELLRACGQTISRATNLRSPCILAIKAAISGTSEGA